jgi:phytoene/squalene synthetase
MFSVATINFLQDVAIDQQKERIYLPMEDLSRFAVSPAAFERPEAHGSGAR